MSKIEQVKASIEASKDRNSDCESVKSFSTTATNGTIDSTGRKLSDATSVRSEGSEDLASSFDHDSAYKSLDSDDENMDIHRKGTNLNRKLFGRPPNLDSLQAFPHDCHYRGDVDKLKIENQQLSEQFNEKKQQLTDQVENLQNQLNEQIILPEQLSNLQFQNNVYLGGLITVCILLVVSHIYMSWTYIINYFHPKSDCQESEKKSREEEEEKEKNSHRNQICYDKLKSFVKNHSIRDESIITPSILNSFLHDELLYMKEIILTEQDPQTIHVALPMMKQPEPEPNTLPVTLSASISRSRPVIISETDSDKTGPESSWGSTMEKFASMNSI